MSDFYAVFIKSSIHIPGDERSRQAPGHGYPAHDEMYTEVVEFGTLEELKKWIENNDKYGSRPYRVVRCSPLNVRLQAVIEISEDRR